MNLLRRGKMSRRVRQIWYSVWATTLGLVVLTVCILRLEAHRNTDLGDPTAGVTSTAKSTTDVTASPIRFREVAGEMGIVMSHGPGPRSRALPEDTGSGVAWGDYDGDGDWDLYFVNFAGPLGRSVSSEGTNRLFRNDGPRFTDVTESAGVGDLEGFGMGATFADYDGDGDQDIYVTNFGPNRLFRNRGDGTFEDVAAEAGVDDHRWSTGAAWGDFDRDGNLDLYVCNYVQYEPLPGDADSIAESAFGAYAVPFTLNPNAFDPAPNRLYRNRGDGHFEDVAERFRVSNPDGRSLGATFCDLDGDGWLDLYVNNDVSTNRLYRNMRGELGPVDPHDHLMFVDLSAMTGTADPRGSMGLSVGDLGGRGYQPDGLPDLFITHWVAQENALYQSLLTAGGQWEYRDKSRHYRLGEISIDTVGWGTALADLDLDGRADLVVANGSTLERKDDPRYLIAEPIFLLWNTGGRFADVAPCAGRSLSRNHCARGLAVADFDEDGDVDVAVAINRGQPLLLRNETQTDSQSVKVILRGPSSACFGAKVELIAGGRRQVQWYGADVTYLGMHAPEIIFGLGTISQIDEIRVTWADGQQSVGAAATPGSRVEIRHPDDRHGSTSHPPSRDPSA